MCLAVMTFPLYNPLPLSVGSPTNLTGYHSHDYAMCQSEGIFEGVIRFDFEFIKKDIILDEPDLIKQTL